MAIKIAESTLCDWYFQGLLLSIMKSNLKIWKFTILPYILHFYFTIVKYDYLGVNGDEEVRFCLIDVHPTLNWV